MNYCVQQIGSILATAFAKSFVQLLVSRGRVDNTVCKLSVEFSDYAARHLEQYIHFCKKALSESLPEDVTITLEPDAVIITTKGLRKVDGCSGGKMTFVVEFGPYTHLIGPYYELHKAANVPIMDPLPRIQEPCTKMMSPRMVCSMAPQYSSTMPLNNVNTMALNNGNTMAPNNGNTMAPNNVNTMATNYANGMMANYANGMMANYANGMMANYANGMMANYGNGRMPHYTDSRMPQYSCTNMPSYYDLWFSNSRIPF
eukprot:GEMP01069664.1.p1 GENE.GEMP01069664.1~~GEMP01069664.1.p1  ORF type:complete len:258 (+),score=34.44 GEMP01069664.1:379-1152(+)